MQSIKDIRKKIKTVEGLRKIISAMRLIASSKLKKSQAFLEPARLYSDGYIKILEALPFEGPFSLLLKSDIAVQGSSKPNRLFIVLTANKGLCGGFINNFLKKYELIKTPEDLLLIIGKRGLSLFEKQHSARLVKIRYYNEDAPEEKKEPLQSLESERLYEKGFFVSEQTYKDLGEKQKFVKEFDLNQKKFSLTDIYFLASYIMEQIQGGFLSEVCIIYAQFKNTIRHPIMAQSLYPIPQNLFSNKISESLPLVEPINEEFAFGLIRQFIHSQLYRCLLETELCEHAERMMVMEEASKNTKAEIDRLKVRYNRTRQQVITNELIDIVGAANAVTG